MSLYELKKPMEKCSNVIACWKLRNRDREVMTKEKIDKCNCLKKDMCKLIIDLLNAWLKEEAININNSVRFSS